MGQSATKAGVVVWGSPEFGQLGIGSLPAEDRSVNPRLVEGLRSVPVRFVNCGGHHSVAVSESGEVYSWGQGKHGQLGHGDTKDCLAPRAIRALQSKLIRQVSCAEHHTAAVSESGVLFTWGRGQSGRLGHGNCENEPLPKVVEALMGHHVVQVSCGDFHTACLTANPSIQMYTWGLGLNGRLGHGDEADLAVPTIVQALATSQVSFMACGGHHTAAILEPTGNLFTWGGGAFGKLGHGNRLAQLVPKLVSALSGKHVVTVSLGPHHSAALTAKGEVYTWGQAGRLGHAAQGAEVDEMIPRVVLALQSAFIVQVSCGHSHCCALTETGDVWAWGSSRAFGHTESDKLSNSPSVIRALQGKAIVQVSCGISHSIVLSDYRRLTGKVALAATRQTQAVATPASASKEPPAQASRVEELVEESFADFAVPEAQQLSDASPKKLATAAEAEDSEKQAKAVVGLPRPTAEREIAFLSAELKAYQEQTLRLAKQLQDANSKLHTLQNENSFLRSELEVIHQCSSDQDERLDALRRHFLERTREMERAFAEKESQWRSVFQTIQAASEASHSGAAG
mmetsp:Transcript_53547/g.142325  ORF Transcript_53547/g.142325 Transcript_53547/m.142325 type:complete len:569 (-) Transcript_53547:26-1732(-)